jgi:hypothetical protein
MDASFLLPGTETRIDAKVQVAWADPEGRAGISFVVIAPAICEELQRWANRKMKDEGWEV